jgi:recombination protein RecR
VAYPEPLERLIQAFERFPGVGRRTAERLAFHALRDPAARELGPALAGAVANTTLCRVCRNVTEKDPCAICSDEKRDAATICVVEHPKDVEAIERAGVFKGRYHVLMGALNPAEGTDAAHLFVGALVERVRRDPTNEVILATDPDAEGEATARLVFEALHSAGIAPRITRMARGLPSGSAIEYLHRGVLEDALAGRIALAPRPSK